MSRKHLFGILPILAALVASLAISATAASAAICATNVLCNGKVTNGLRDDFTEPPTEGTFPGGYGTSLFAVNTHGPLRLTALGSFNENPAGYAFFGVKLDKNPLTSTSKCEKARGWIPFVDIQNAKNNKGEFSAAYDNTSPGYNGAWKFSVTSDQTICPENQRGKVTIERVALFFPNLATGNVQVTGTLNGVYSQPAAANCPAGGIALSEVQILTVNGTAGVEVKITNGAAGTALICFVSANNYLFPKTAPTWAPFTDSEANAEPGIWKD